MDGGAWWAAVDGVHTAESVERDCRNAVFVVQNRYTVVQCAAVEVFSLSCIGEGNGNPLQYSCLENPRDGVAWWAAVCGVSQSRT